MIPIQGSTALLFELKHIARLSHHWNQYQVVRVRHAHCRLSNRQNRKIRQIGWLVSKISAV